MGGSRACPEGITGIAHLEMMSFGFGMELWNVLCLWKKFTEDIPRESICGYTKDRSLGQAAEKF